MDGDPLEIVGDLIDAQFRVDSFVGFGDLSVVYRGFHVGVEANVAIKFLELPTTLDEALVAPLIRSFREGTKLHYRLARGHMHIAQSIGSGQTLAPRTGAVLPYMVREWLDGESLNHNFSHRRARHLTGRSLVETVDLFRGALEGLAYAHRQGVAHLALNPSNLFLAQHGAETRLKILDFGVAHAMNEHAGPIRARKSAPFAPTNDITGLRVLVPAYAAPEQLDAAIGQPGSWTDVYAMALLFVEALTDHPMFGEAPPSLDQAMRPNARKIELPPNLDPGIASVLQRALMFAPRERQASAGVFWKDLSEALPNRSIPIVRRPSTAPKMPAVRMHAPTLLGLQEVPSKEAPLKSVSKAPPIPPKKPSTPPPALKKPSVPPPPMAARAQAKPIVEVEEFPTAQEMHIPTPMGDPMYLQTIARARDAASATAHPQFLDQARLPPPPIMPAMGANMQPAAPPSQNMFAAVPSTAPHPFFSAPPQNQPIVDPNAPHFTPLGSSRSAETLAPPPLAPSKKMFAIIAGGVAGVLLLIVIVVFATRSSPETTANTIPTASASKPNASPTSSIAVANLPPIPTAPTTPVIPPPLPASTDDTSTAQNNAAPAFIPKSERHRFYVSSGRAALDAAGESLADCKRPHGRHGAGEIRATFFPDSGKVIHVQLGPPYAGSEQGKCIIQKYKAARMDPFRGKPSAINYTFFFPR